MNRLRPTNMADLVAAALRERILCGNLADGALLPKQEDLAEEFGTSGMSVREGLRILEAEGLLTIRRGKLGGALVHAPRAANVAYVLGLVLEAKHVELREVGAALRDLEPVCAGLCAARPDRAEAVVPRLAELHDLALATGDDVVASTRAGRLFHETLVAASGSETMITVIGALESIWSAHAEAWVTESSYARAIPNSEYAATRNADHAALIEAIAAGDAEQAGMVARRHLDSSTLYRAPGDSAGAPVRSDLLAPSRRPAPTDPA